jgi:hypothetical protein
MDDIRRRCFRTISMFGCAFALLICFAEFALAQTNSALLIAPFSKELAVEAEASAVFLEGGHIAESDNDEDFRLSGYGTQGHFRLIPGELKSPRIGYDFTYLDLDTSFDALPDRLVDQSIAIGFPIAQIDEWILGASVGVGYAGDGGFGDGDAWYGLSSIAAFRQIDDKQALVFVLDYDGNRTFLPDIPIPGVAYIRRIDDRLEMTLGVPISSIKWEATDQLTVELAYSLPDDFRVDIGYEFIPHLALFGRVRQQRVGFFFDGLAENYDRIIFQQRRAEAGVRFEPNEQIHADLALGYAWGGEFSEGFDSRRTNEIADISDEPYIRAGVELRF